MQRRAHLAEELIEQTDWSVTREGAPLSDAVVTFSSQGEGRQASGQTDIIGHGELLYAVEAKGAMIGKHVVRIQLVAPDDADSGPGDTTNGVAPSLPAAATNG